MKKILSGLPVVAIAACVAFTTGCGPTGDKNSTDAQTQPQETATDTTRYPAMNDSGAAVTDTTGQTDAMKK